MAHLSRVNAIAATTISALSLTALLSGCGQLPSAGKSQATTSPAVKYHFYMDVLTGGMIGKPGWPEFSPADFTLPANADVTVTITSFDDGAAPVAAQYGRVRGTVDGNATVNGQPVKFVDPRQVAHTFTIAALNLNVPIPAATSKTSPEIVQFAFHTPQAGTYTWQCYAPCGSGSSGWGGAMATDGYMMGKVTVANE